MVWFSGCKCPNWFWKICTKLCWPHGTPVAFHNFKFHGTLWISITFLYVTRFDSRSFAAKILFSVFFPLASWVFLFGARPLTQGPSIISENCWQTMVDRHFHELGTWYLQYNTRKVLALRFSSKKIIRIAEDVKITVSMDVMLIYMSKQRLSRCLYAMLALEAIVPRACTSNSCAIEYSKHPHIRTNGLKTPGWNLANKAPFL